MMINKISQMMQGELRKVDGTLRADKFKQAAVPDADRSELSASGKMQREAKGDMQIISAMVKAQPDVRTEKIAEARAKIAMGFYNSEAFANKLAENLTVKLAGSTLA